VVASDQPAVVIRVLLEQARAALDVREEEGDATLRQMLASRNARIVS
jgi:hypothetical protein